jgi:hypothetical protein
MGIMKKFFKYSGYDVNYTDQILRAIVKTTYAKKKLNTILLMLMTIIARLHIDAIFSMIFHYNNIYIDFWVQILISILLVIKSGWIFELVKKFDEEIYMMTRYLVNNYSEANYIVWKRKATFVICFYLIIYLHLVNITSQVLILYVVQYLICYIVIEIIEKRHQMYARLANPQTPTCYGDHDFDIIKTSHPSDQDPQKSPFRGPSQDPIQGLSQDPIQGISPQLPTSKASQQSIRLNEGQKIFIMTDNFTLVPTATTDPIHVT